MIKKISPKKKKKKEQEKKKIFIKKKIMKGYIHVKKIIHSPNMLQDIPYEELQFCAKNEVNPGNRFRDIKSFHMCREIWPA